LSFCALLLFACQTQDKEMTMLDDISSVSIAESDGYGGINENYITTIDKDTIISIFEKAFENAEGRKQKVDVNTEKPDYDILIHNTWEMSRLMYVDHENNSFDISPEKTKDIRVVFDNQ